LQNGDVALIDNLKFMHDRIMHKGTRKVLVAMAKSASGDVVDKINFR